MKIKRETKRPPVSDAFIQLHVSIDGPCARHVMARKAAVQKSRSSDSRNVLAKFKVSLLLETVLNGDKCELTAY